MKLIVDTNIIFSAIISDKGKIGDLLLNTNHKLDLYSPLFLLDELGYHSAKILSLTEYSKQEYEQIKSIVTANIGFIDTTTITDADWESAKQLLIDIDVNDVPFLALSISLDAVLWTGDKKLIKGLQRKGYKYCVSTEILFAQFFNAK